MKVINLFAGPGSGKSTTAAGLFFAMKSAGMKVELVTEFAKDLTYDEASLGNQLFILAEQDRRLRRLVGKVDYAITDSPLLLSLIYAGDEFLSKRWFNEACWGVFKSYNNVNFFIRAVKPYRRYGRSQSEEEARALDVRILNLLTAAGISSPPVDGDVDAPANILMRLLS